MVNNKYYVGFEGEPEIQFICKRVKDDDVIIVWEGYFDEIMRCITPEEKGWTGLAYYYNMYLGWYEESPWLIDDLHMVLQQFNTINYEKLSNEACEVFKLICNLLKEALDNNLNILISRE